MRKMSKIIRNECGQAIILGALVMAVVAGMAAVIIDLGGEYITKSNLQNAADAASLAAVGSLPDTNAAINAAINCAGKNGMKATANGVTKSGDTVTVTVNYNGDSNKILVVCTRNVSFNFASIFGYSSKNVSAHAAATKGSLGDAFNYALFSGSKTSPLTITGCNLTVNGSVHTNNNFSLTGSNLGITGSLEASSSITLSGCNANVGTGQAASYSITGSNTNFGTKITSAAPSVSMPDLSATLISEAGSNGQSHNGDGTFSGNNFTISGPTYYNGKVSISGSNWSGTGCIIASGNITINGSNLSDSSSDAICVYSINGNITFSGSNVSLNNIIVYAPNGQISFSGSNVTIGGRVIGNTISTGGSNPKITAGTKEFNSLPSGGSSKLIE